MPFHPRSLALSWLTDHFLGVYRGVVPAADAITHSVKADDGAMGSAFFRFGADSRGPWSGMNAVCPFLLDWRYPWTARWRGRISVAPGLYDGTLNSWNGAPAPEGRWPIPWLGMGVVYSSEGFYSGGIDIWSYVQGVDSEGYPVYSNSVRLLYDDTGSTVGDPQTGLLQNVLGLPGSYQERRYSSPLVNRVPFDVMQSYTPATLTYADSINGVLGTPVIGLPYNKVPWKNPMALWWGSHNAPITLDVGSIEVSGRLLLGAQDDIGWDDWTLTNCTVYVTPDGGWSWGVLGGPGMRLTGLAFAFGADADRAVPVSGDRSWSAVSPLYSASAGGFADLMLSLPQGTAGMDIRLKDASGAEVVSGNIIPSLVSVPGGGADMGKISIRSVPVPFRVHVTQNGSVNADARGGAQARLAGVWVSFTVGLDDSVTLLSDTTWECFLPASEVPGTFDAVASTGATASVEIAPGGSVSISAEAIVVERRAMSVSTSATVVVRGTKAVPAAALVRDTFTRAVTSSERVVARVPKTVAADADVVLRYYLARSPMVGRAFLAGGPQPVDSFLVPTTRQVQSDAAVALTTVRSLPAAALVAGRTLAQVDAGAAVSTRMTRSVTGDASVSGPTLRQVVAGAAVAGQGTAQVQGGALVAGRSVSEAQAGALVAQRVLAEASADAWVAGAITVSVQAGAVVAGVLTPYITVPAGAVVQASSSRTVQAGAVVAVLGTVIKNVAVTALVKGSFRQDLSADALVQTGLGTQVAVTADAFVLMQQARTVSADARVAVTVPRVTTIPASALVRDAGLAFVEAGAVVRERRLESVPADAIIEGSTQVHVQAGAAVADSPVREVQAGAVVKAHVTLEVFADAAVFIPGMQTVSAGAVVLATTERTVEAGAAVQGSVTVDSNADAFITAGSTVRADAVVVDLIKRGRGRKHGRIHAGRGGARIHQGRNDGRGE